MMKVGFAGAGNMAAAMARGWAGAEDGPEGMLFCDLEADRAASLAREVGGDTRAALADLVADSDVIVLAVKPAALDAVAGELSGAAPAILSMLAATPVARLAEAFPGVPLVRVMPNQPVEVRRGVLCYVPPDDAVPADLASAIVRLLGVLGVTVPIEEHLIDAAMAVMSCSPAYVARFAETLAAAGVEEGLDPALAADLVREAIAGSAELLRVHDPGALRRAVAAPGGTTEAGLVALEQGGFDGAIAAAVEASLERFR
jgi:pyrroline-5-carboxylate reductase